MKNKILFAFSLIFGLMMINAGLDKFFHYMPMPENVAPSIEKVFKAFGDIGWLLPLVAVVEIMAGTLFIFPKTRALGAIMIFPIMVGIMLINTVTDMAGFPIAMIFLAVNLWAIYDNRMKYSVLVG